MQRKGRIGVGKRASDTVFEGGTLSNDNVSFDQGVAFLVEAIESVDVDHHASRAVNTSEVVSEQFLCETGEGMDGTFVIQDGMDVLAITKPIKMGTPEIAATLTHAPTAAAGFTKERVEKGFTLGAATGAKADRAETGTLDHGVEKVVTASSKDGKGFTGGCVVGGLHENVRHTSAGPVSLEEDGQVGVIASETRVADNGGLEISEASVDGGGPGWRWNGVAVVLATKGAERCDTDSVLGNIKGIKGRKADKRIQKGASARDGPITD